MMVFGQPYDRHPAYVLFNKFRIEHRLLLARRLAEKVTIAASGATHPGKMPFVRRITTPLTGKMKTTSTSTNRI